MLGSNGANAQYLLQAPNSTDENNYQWYEASDINTVLGTDFFYEVSQPGIYFATYDGTKCGANATGYFIITNCSSPDNEVTLDISASLSGSETISWSPAVTGDQTRPTVTSSQSVVRYTATITKAGNSSALPNFTVVCLEQAATLVNDVVTMDEDTSVVIDIYANDSDIPTDGSLTVSSTINGSALIDNNGTANDPSDDIVTYTPNPNYNGTSSFTYTVCNSLGDCSTATVDVTVLPIVDAFDDSVVTVENTPVEVDIVANDNDVPTTGTITTTNPANGTLVLNENGTPNNPTDDTITYSPNLDFDGNDSFDYTICDGLSNCSTATVTVMVTNVTDLDSDNDGIVDSFEDLNLDGDNDPATDPTDSDGDGFPDYLDIDSDNDGIPDNVEAQFTSTYILPSELDVNANGLDDAYEGNGIVGLFPIDTDNDSLPDYVDEDSDDDNIPDNVEGNDYNHDGIADVSFIGSDKDNDGLDDGFEGAIAIDVDVNDEINDPINDLPNTDSDLESDYRDSDDDDDGIETVDEDGNEDGNYVNDDADADGTPDYLDSDLEITGEEVEVFNVITPNGDGVHDVLVISGLENYPNNTLNIYNRWGVLVYTTRAYNTEGNVFSGISEGRVTVDQDNKLPVGTYFYVLDYEESTGNAKSLTGYIYINR